MEQSQQLIDLAQKGLTQMAEKLNVTLPHLWEVLIKQQYVEAIQSFAVFGLCLIVWYLLYKSKEYIRDKIDDFSPFMIMGIIILSLITIVLFDDTITGIGQIINPEYYAIKDIVEFIGEMKGGQ